MADDLGFSQTQLESIGMLVHALYNNPKVLYAPNNSAVNLIISKVINSISECDAVWPHISPVLIFVHAAS